MGNGIPLVMASGYVYGCKTAPPEAPLVGSPGPRSTKRGASIRNKLAAPRGEDERLSFPDSREAGDRRKTFSGENTRRFFCARTLPSGILPGLDIQSCP